MKRTLLCVATLLIGVTIMADHALADVARQSIPFQRVKVADAFWWPRMETNRKVTVPHNIKLCVDTGRISNFARAGGLEEGDFQGKYYDDSDVYKMLEGVAYTLAQHPDPELEKRADEIITKIAAAQEDNGYLNSYYTLREPDQKWTNLHVMHELYCAGHMFEAAVAYYNATGKKNLLEVAQRKADLIDRIFGHDKRIGYPGHQEIELALIKLYKATGEERYRELSKFFIDVRGRKDAPGNEASAYCQAHKPVREHEDIYGHAVRAMYLYSGVADVAALTGDASLIAVMDRLWHRVVLEKMYITGGVGARHEGEAFGEPYELPNDSAYCETCASIGLVLWNQRLWQLHGESKYFDVVERAMYNGVLSGVSLSGDRFFYVNPLASNGGHHRQEWYGTACCPTNIVRFLPSVPGYVYGEGKNDVWVNLYVAGEATAKTEVGEIKIKQDTRYPWAGDTTLTLNPPERTSFALHLRVPSWCEDPRVKVNRGTISRPRMEKGYIVIERKWEPGDTVWLDLPMPPRHVASHPLVKTNHGLLALQRGPLVYCLEAVDNGGGVFDLAVERDAELESEFMPDLLGGIVVIRARGLRRPESDWNEKLYQKAVDGERATVTAIPYYAWDHREPGEMVVWIPESLGRAHRLDDVKKKH